MGILAFGGSSTLACCIIRPTCGVLGLIGVLPVSQPNLSTSFHPIFSLLWSVNLRDPPTRANLLVMSQKQAGGVLSKHQ